MERYHSGSSKRKISETIISGPYEKVFRMTKTILIVGTLDTKGEEIKYLKEKIERGGHYVRVVDVGILNKPYQRR